MTSESKATRELRAQVEETRQELGRTVAELAARADVKARMKEKAAGLRERGRGNPAPLAGIGAAVLACAVLLVLRRTRGGR